MLMNAPPSDRARLLRQRQTSAEGQLWRVLRNRALNGWKFRRQCPIDRYVADFACVEAKLVVEVDGATHGTDAERASDQIRTDALVRSGFEVLRITNAEIRADIEGVRETILASLERRATL
jgi:very-short-patch-repair endonuclease